MYRTAEIIAALGRSGASAEQLQPHIEYSEQCAIAIQSKQILAAARGRCIEEARKSPPIDRDLTADRERVTQAIRGAGGTVRAEPPPNLGRMSDGEFRQYKSQFGF